MASGGLNPTGGLNWGNGSGTPARPEQSYSTTYSRLSQSPHDTRHSQIQHQSPAPSGQPRVLGNLLLKGSRQASTPSRNAGSHLASQQQKAAPSRNAQGAVRTPSRPMQSASEPPIAGLNEMGAGTPLRGQAAQQQGQGLETTRTQLAQTSLTRTAVLNNSNYQPSTPARAMQPSVPATPLHFDKKDSQDGDVRSLCVTVFGFAPHDLDLLVAELERCGTLIKRQPVASTNWMHVQFETRIGAQRALSKNGFVVASKIMIGVKPCESADFISSCAKPLREAHHLQQGVLGTPARRTPARTLSTRTTTATAPQTQPAATPSKAGYLSYLTEYIFNG
eukprot:TRINITY_DN11411_c0_g1_i2.p1 TRINITY_DN11411_c0_g1~~TRINITY_DN11411_c0_g1_i2.p1  ORF type:complete len:335 (+),score=46.27 TRINITY_DN11411_c0_g1_i2:33-1037(+)